MIRVSTIGKVSLSEARDRVIAGQRLLEEICPLASRQAQHRLHAIIVADIRAQTIALGRRTMILGIDFVRRSPPQVLALALVYGATRLRLARYLRRYDSADRHAQYWRRVAREVIAVACALDHGEDPSGYIPGVSSGPWEVWARDWLGRGLLAVPPGRRDIRNWLRDLRRLGVPKWLRRSLAIVRGWRTAPYNGR